MDYLAAVNAQAETLTRVVGTVRGELQGVDLDPWRRGALGVVAMGAALHAAHAFVAELRSAGRRAYAISATELLDERVPDLADAYVAVSQSGRSRETVEAMRALAGRPRLGVTAGAGAPLAEAVDALVWLGALDDSPIYTLGYTATLAAYGLLAEALGAAPGGPGWDGLPGLVDRVLAGSEPVVAEAAARMRTVRMVDFVGQGAGLAAAAEGALLLREGARVPTSAMDTYQYLHGPMEPLDSRMACVAFGDGREIELATDVAAAGATAVLVTTADVAPPAAAPKAAPKPTPNNSGNSDGARPGAPLVVRLPRAEPVRLAVLQTLPIQLLTWRLAQANGLAVEGFRYQQADTKLAG